MSERLPFEQVKCPRCGELCDEHELTVDGCDWCAVDWKAAYAEIEAFIDSTAGGRKG